MKQRMTLFIATVASITLLQVDGQAATVEHDDYSVTYQESATQRPTARYGVCGCHCGTGVNTNVDVQNCQLK